MPQDQPGGRRGAAADHVLVGAADVGRDDLQRSRRARICVLFGQREFRIVDGLDFYFARSHIGDAAIACHSHPPYLPSGGVSRQREMHVAPRLLTCLDGRNERAASADGSRAGLGHRVVVLNRAAADADRADYLAPAILQRYAAGKRDQPAVRMLDVVE